MSRRRRRRAYNTFFLFFTLIMVGVAAFLSYYVLNENNYFKEYWPESWKSGKSKEKEKTKDTEEEIDFDDSSFYSIYEHVDSYTSLRDISSYKDFTSTELLGIVKEDFVTTDFKETDEVSSTGLKIYTLEDSILLTYLKRIFGDDISIDPASFENCSAVVNGTTGASLGGTGMSFISYDKESKKYKVTFTSLGGSVEYATILDRKIMKATKSKYKIVVSDKIIYYSLEVNDARTAFTYKIFADPEHSYQIDSRSFTADNVSTGVIDVEDYLKKTSTIQYTFQLKDGKYYYQSSSIKKG